MNNRRKIGYILCLVLVMLLLFGNIFWPAHRVQGTWKADELPSQLAVSGPMYEVNGGGSGHLSYGPYVQQGAGRYTVTVYYSATAMGSTIDAADLGERLCAYELPVGEGPFSFPLLLETASDGLELRCYYGGEGRLSLEKIVLQGESSEQRQLRLLADAVCLFVLLGWLWRLTFGKRENRPWHKRFCLALLPSLAAALTLFFFAPASMCLQSYESMGLVIGDFAGRMLLLSVLTGTVLALMLSCWCGRAFDLGCVLLTALLAAAWLQSVFINTSYGQFDGNAIQWENYRGNAWLSAALWLITLLSSLWLWKRKEYIKPAITALPCFVAALQLLLCGIMALTTGSAAFRRDGWYLSGEGEFEVSEEGNILVLVIDYCSNEYFDELFAASPELEGVFADFTYYTNADAAIMGTIPSVNRLFTGAVLDEQSDLEQIQTLYLGDGLTELWQSEHTRGFYRRMDDAGYDVCYYGPGGVISTNEITAQLVDNITYSDKLEIEKDMDAVVRGLLRFSAYRLVPTPLKRCFWTGEYDLSTAITVRGSKNESAPITENWGFYETLEKQGLRPGSGKRCSIIHLNGTHPICHTTEDCEYSAATTGTQETLRGCVRLLELYMQQLRELGVYEQSALIVMADHGDFADAPQIPILLKQAGETHESMQRSAAPVSMNQFMATVLALAGQGYEEYGDAVMDVAEDAQIRRSYFNRRRDPAFPVEDGNDNIYERYTYTGDRDDLMAAIASGPDAVFAVFDK